ncbi:MAG: molybdopterin-dependent oxidoreductase [Symbiopectobacterium sp.]
MALVNAFANVLINEGLYDTNFVAQHTEGFDEYRALVAKYTPEYIAEITCLSPQLIRDAMRMYAAAPSATILWGMGVTRWTQGVDVVKGLSSLELLTSNLGRPNVGVGPVRGQNNVQGACNMGALPNQFPWLSECDRSRSACQVCQNLGRARSSRAYRLFPEDVPHKIKESKIKANSLMGEDPLQTEPDLSMVCETFSELELLIVQDIFMTYDQDGGDGRRYLPGDLMGRARRGILRC